MELTKGVGEWGVMYTQNGTEVGQSKLFAYVCFKSDNSTLELIHESLFVKTRPILIFLRRASDLFFYFRTNNGSETA